MLIPSRARTRLRPSVNWWMVIVNLERHGYTHGAIAGAIGSSRTTVESWKNKHVEPRHIEGELLLELWRAVIGKGREDVPMKVGHTLSAASFK